MHQPRSWRVPLIAGAIAMAVPLFTFAAQAPAPAAARGVDTSNFDIRLTGAASALAARQPGGIPQMIQDRENAHAAGATRGLAQLRRVNPTAEIQPSPVTRVPEVVSVKRGSLTPPSQASGDAIARSFVAANLEIYGLTADDVANLRTLGESRGGQSGLRMVRLEQRVNDRPVFQAETRFLIDKEGSLVRSVGTFIPNAFASASALPDADTAAHALSAALRSVGIDAAAHEMTMRRIDMRGHDSELAVAHPAVAAPVRSSLVYFPLANGVLVPAWELVIFGEENDYLAVVDAFTGTLLWRKGMREHASTHEARFSVYVQADGKTPADNPAPDSPTIMTTGQGTQAAAISRTIVSMLSVQDTTASPDGWIADGGNTTTGNNVDAYLDAASPNGPDTGALDNNGRPIGNLDVDSRNRDFLGAGYAYTPAPNPGPDAGDAPNGTAFRRGVVTQLFYVTNWYHDQLYALGFDEAAGNFQTDNFGRGGVGADAVLAEAQDYGGTNNANFSTPPDGSAGRMQMYVFTGPAPDRDGSLDTEIVIHELTHGTSNRLVNNARGLQFDPARGMGEGWSDFFALSMLNNTNTDGPTGKYAVGGYATYQLGGPTVKDNYLYGIRRFPYSTDNTINPLTWADVDDHTIDQSGGIPPSPLNYLANGAAQVHNAGSVWANTLWEVRARIIDDPNGADGDVPTGNMTALQLVVDALKMTPANPSFTEARDAILDADCATNGCANEESIWGGFADRGLGYRSHATSGRLGQQGSGLYLGVKESFLMPRLDVASFQVDDSVRGNNNGGADPGEQVTLHVSLENPWRHSSKGVSGVIATLVALTPGVTVLDDTAFYPAIDALDTQAGDGFEIYLDPSTMSCGKKLEFKLTTISELGMTETKVFVIRVGTDDGLGTPVTYTNSTALAVPDNNRRGVASSIAIAADFEVADVDFLFNMTHTWTGDIVLALKGPNGHGGPIVYRRGEFTGAGGADNFVNTRIDDDLAFEDANDLTYSAAAAAPFTKSWLPAFNGTIWTAFDPPYNRIETVPFMSRFDGQSVNGTWLIRVGDMYVGDTGSVTNWSLIVTPRMYDCTAISGAVITAKKSVDAAAAATAFQPGSSVVYTITLTNIGSVSQGDNAGHELTDILPAGLTITGVSSSTGVAAYSGQTVTWNGSIAPSSSVTVTINATIGYNIGDGTDIANQASINVDMDGDNVNEMAILSDDPGTPLYGDATEFTVAPGYILEAFSLYADNQANNSGVAEPGESIVFAPTWFVPPSTPAAVSATSTIGNSGALTITDSSGAYSSTLPDDSAACSNCFAIDVPVSRPSAHYDEIVTETLVTTPAGTTPAHGWVLHVGESFADVPSSGGGFYRFIETIFHNGITAGCGGNNFCPDGNVTRAQMAVFLLKAKYGASYAPPAATGTVFGDVSTSTFAAGWIEQLAAEGVTAGCGGGNYCPDNPVNREQMAVFLLKTREGSAYAPPAATGVFGDVPASNPFAPWIEQIFAEGITAGCGGGNYCPSQNTTRGQMSVFLTKAMSLTLFN